ncbi:Poly(A)+ RNA export protein [Entamoeba marina]
MGSALITFSLTHQKNYYFKSQYNKTTDKLDNLYSVNTISYRYDGSMLTGGSDGVLNFWDIFTYNKLYDIKPVEPGVGISCSCYSPDGNYLCYGIGYDWSKGAYGSSQTPQCGLLIKQVDELVCRPNKTKY